MEYIENNLPILIFWVLNLCVLFFIIKYAIDSSDTAANIKEIKSILNKIQLHESNNDPDKNHEA